MTASGAKKHEKAARGGLGRSRYRHRSVVGVAHVKQGRDGRDDLGGRKGLCDYRAIGDAVGCPFVGAGTAHVDFGETV